ncbi:MAG: hypothetical protein WAU91_09190 [Desulfatitalea sp.]
MKQTIRCVALFFVFVLAALSSTQAGEVTIPNIFTAGTPAVAADVNENFAAVKAAIDDNAANIDTNTSDSDANAAAIADHSQSITTHQGRLARSSGFVNHSEPSTIYGSDNISGVTWNAAQNRYEITLDERLWSSARNCSLIVTPYANSARIATASVSAGTDPILFIFIHDLTGNLVQGSFHWVLFIH